MDAPENQPSLAFQKRTLFAVAAAGVGIALLLAAWTLRAFLLYAILGILLSVVLRSAADLIHGWTGCSRRWAVLILALVVVGGAALGAYLAAPLAIEQGRALYERLPEAVEALQRRIGDQPQLTELWSQFTSGSGMPDPGTAVGQVGRIVAAVSGAAGYLGLVLVAALWLAMEPSLYRDGAIRLVPVRHRAFADELLTDLERTIRSWLGGQLVMMAFIGVLTGLGLWAIGVPYSLALGLLAGILEFVPYLGPILSAVPVLLIALATDAKTALWALVVLVAVQQVENNVLQPIVQRSSVDIPPVVLIFVLFAMGALFGVPGLLVATPLLAVAIVVVRKVYIERLLEGRGNG